MKKRNLLFVVTASLLLMSCSEKQSTENNLSTKKKAIKVETQLVKATHPESTLQYSGSITPAVNIPLSFKTMGTVLAINVDEGDQVYQGQVLAEVDKTSSESSHKAAKATQKQAQDAYDRLKTVYDKGSLPEIKWEEVKAKLEQANSMEQISKQNLENCQLIAPSMGIIGSRNLEVGSNAAPGITVLNIMEIKNVFVKISVPENEIGKIKKEQSAEVIIPAIGEEPFEAIVKKIGVSANMVSKTYEVKLRMNNANLIIKPGMVCDVKLNIGDQEEIVAIPYNSVLKRGEIQIVYVVDKQSGTAHQQEVVTGNFINNEIEITSGLSVGDEVIITGQHKLSENIQIEV